MRHLSMNVAGGCAIIMSIAQAALAQDCLSVTGPCFACNPDTRAFFGRVNISFAFDVGGLVPNYEVQSTNVSRASSAYGWEQRARIVGTSECTQPDSGGDAVSSSSSGLLNGSLFISGQANPNPPILALGLAHSRYEINGLSTNGGPSSSTGFGTNVDAEYKGGSALVPGGTTFVDWAYAWSRSDIRSEFELKRRGVNDYEDKIRLSIEGGLNLNSIDENVYECGGPYEVPLYGLRPFVRIVVTAYDANGDLYWVHRNQSAATINTSAAIVGPSGWHGPIYEIDDSRSSECRDSETNALVYERAERDFRLDENVSCEEMLGAGTPLCESYIVGVPGEPAKIVVQQSAWLLNVRDAAAGYPSSAGVLWNYEGDSNESGRVRPADRELIAELDGVVLGGNQSDDYMPLADMDADGDIDSDDLDLFDVYVCLADYNQDGVVDSIDSLDFYDDYGNSVSDADMNEDGIVDVLDFLIFLDYYSAGC